MTQKKFNDISIIAEIGNAHEGSFALACSYIESAKKSGADAVKFQTHISEAESSNYDKFRIKSKYIDDKSRNIYWDRTSFTLNQYKRLKKLTEKLGMFFLSSPFSLEAVDLLKKINVKAWKIGSGELTNYPMIEKIARTKKPIIISTGLSNINEIKNTIKLIKKYHSNIIIMQCTSLYPCPDDKIGLNVISELKKKFPYKVGFSDHSGDPTIGIAAYSMGAEILEVHVTYDKDIKTFDSSSSLDFKELEFLKKSLNRIKIIKSNKINKNKIPKYLISNKKLFEKSIFLKKDLKKGSLIKLDDISFKKPVVGIHAKEYKSVIGKKLKINLKKGNPLLKKNIK